MKQRIKTFALVKKHLRVDETEIKSPSRMLLIVHARALFCAIRRLQGRSLPEIGKEINRTHPSVANLIEQLPQMLSSHGDFSKAADRILKQLKLYDNFRQLLCENACAPARNFPPKPCRPRYTFNSGCKYAKTLHSFNFTPDEEIGIERACHEAERFFETYGKGNTPNRIINDKSKYL